MPKQKTNSAAKKRFKVSATGKLLHRSAMRKATREKLSSKRKRRVDRPASVHRSDAGTVRKLLGLR